MKSIEVTTYSSNLYYYAYSAQFQVSIYAILLLYELTQQITLFKYRYNS